MRSIRRSLTAYLLALLTVTLGIVGLIIDQVTGRALEARQKAAVDLVDAQFANRCRDERQRVDEALLREAQKLGTEMRKEYFAQSRKEFDRFRYIAALFHTDLSGHPLTRAVAAANAGAISSRLFREYFSHLPIDESILNRLGDPERADYYQINSSSGRLRWRSESLDNQSLPHDPKPAEEFRFDDTALIPSGLPVRRLVLKVPLSMSIGPGASGPSRGRMERRSGRTDDGDGGPPPGPPRNWSRSQGGPGFFPTHNHNQFGGHMPCIYVQCAKPRTGLDQVIAGFRHDRDAERETVAGEVKLERETLRNRLVVVGLIAFLAFGAGAQLLVSAGMRPLHSLSEAVSKVSEKDFKLPHDGRGLPLELSAIYQRLNQTLDQLRRAFTREKQAVADISHELRTPIASLQATLDVALRKSRTPEQYRTTLDECRLINKQLGQLVERIMTLASLDAGREQPMVLRIDAAEVASACAAVIRPLAEAHGLTLDAHIEAPLELDTDPDKLREILMNVLHNAVEYNRAGGRVEVRGFLDGGRAVFEVQDTGIGMSAEVRERIFERFFRADPSRHATGVHAGLGLAIVKEYVDRLGGVISVTSEPGRGTCFRLEFPAPADAELAPADRAEPVAAAS